MSDTAPAAGLPRPYYDAGFWGSRKQAARAFWDWYACTQKAPPAWSEHSTEALRTLVLEERELPGVETDITASLYQATEEEGIPLELFARQIRSAVREGEELRFATYDDLARFMHDGVCALAEAMGHLVDIANRFQLPHARAFSRALFLISRLVLLPEDVNRGRLYIPLEDLEYYDIEEERFFSGEVNEALRKVLWRMTVRARDELAQAEPLAPDLPWRVRGVYKRYWIGGLDLLARIERRNFDVWSDPIQINWFDRSRIRLQTFFTQSALSG